MHPFETAPQRTFHPPAPAGMPVAELALALMDAVEFGLAACRRDGTLLHANRAARRELGAGAALQLADGVLCASGADAQPLRSALGDAARGIRRLLRIGSGGAALMVATQPLVVEEPGASAVLLMLGRRSLCSPLGLELLALSHGLTLAEKRVLSALIDTRGPRRIAQDNGVQLSTVRTQIQSIRDKVGVRNVDELLVRVAQVPAMAAMV